MARGHAWFDELVSGRVASIPAVAARETVTEVYVSRLIDLAFLATDIVQAILDSTQPVELTTQRLSPYRAYPLEWPEQRQAFGF